MSSLIPILAFVAVVISGVLAFALHGARNRTGTGIPLIHRILAFLLFLALVGLIVCGFLDGYQINFQSPIKVS